MAFENSPGLDNPGKPRQTFNRWLYLHRRALFAALGLALAFLLLTAVLFFGRSLLRAEPGGLAGCLQNAAGQPVAGAIQAGDKTASAAPDGCFFFASLQPGDYQVIINAGGTQKVVAAAIHSGQATELGTIHLP